MSSLPPPPLYDKNLRIFTFRMDPTGQLKGGTDPWTPLASYAADGVVRWEKPFQKDNIYYDNNTSVLKFLHSEGK